MEILQPNDDTTFYSLTFKIEITVDTSGLHHVTLPPSKQYFITESNVIGIQTDVLTENSLAFEDEKDFTINMRGYGEENTTSAAYFDPANLTSGLQDIPLNASSDLGNIFPPLQLHLNYGI